MTKYRRHITVIAETATEVVASLVVRTADNITLTYGGGVVRFIKPVTQIALDTAVQKIVDEGDSAYPKKWTEDDQRSIAATERARDSRTLEDFARQKNLEEWPTIGQRRSRG